MFTRHRTYDHTKSTSYHKNGTVFQIMYGSGPVSGVFSRDDVQLGSIALKNYNFAEVDNTAGLGIGYYIGKFDGILGLGWDSIVVGGGPSPFGALVQSKQLERNVFAFYLGNFEKGELVLGGVNTDHYEGKLVTVPLIAETYWEVQLNALIVGGKPINAPGEGSTRAIIDSGTSLLAGPVREVRRIAKLVGAVPLIAGEYMIDCKAIDTAPTLTFKLGDFSFSLEPKDYIIDEGSSACILGIMGINIPPPNGPLWILGDVFMRKYYVVFNWDDRALNIAKSTKKKKSIKATQPMDEIIVAMD